jgi:hypothetical protein
MGVVWLVVRGAADVWLFGSLWAVAMETREACCGVAVARR